MDASTRKLRCAVFLSGSGRTLENLLRHRENAGLPLEITCVLSSRPNVRGLEIAAAAKIPHAVVRKRDFGDAAAYQNAMFGPCREDNVDHVIMAGFLQHVLIPNDFENRVINIHPSLLPAFGGKGMYGHHVHEAVLRRGCKISGCTVHFVDDHYDNGPIIHQRSCPVLPDDTPDDLAARVFEQECRALPEAIRILA
ncbi:MAG: phosphoribosylglycinamide formyltransferase [Planctomycetota bacterium]